MPTTTTWTTGNKLPRHKHPILSVTSGIPIDSEHFASQLHRNDPDAHIRENSWSLPNWDYRSSDARSLTPTESYAMLAEARNIHDAALNNTPYTPAYAQPTQAPAPAGPVGQDHTPRVTAAPPAPPLDLTPLIKRLDDVENVALLVMDQGTKVVEDAKVAARQQSFELTRRFDNVTEDVASKVLKQNAAIADIAARVDATRRVEYVITSSATNATHSHTASTPSHKQFDTLLAFATALEPLDRNIWLAGPAGSGKTTAARQLSEVLNLPFDFNGAISMPYELLGYKDANGTYHDTAFRRCYEHGGVWLGDECDASSPQATLALNAALANSHMSFPDSQVPRSPNFIALAAANTWGLGGDSNYVGRNKQDAAFLDRFVTLDWDYDEDLERTLANNNEWVNIVQTIRASVFEHKATMVVSPRASIKGAQLLRANVPPSSVVQAIFGRYRTHSLWPTVGRAAEDFAKQAPAAAAAAAAAKVETKHNGLYGYSLKAPKLSSVDFSDVRVFEGNRRSR